MKRSIRLKISLFLLVLMSIGLTITTLHSHHHLELSHPTDFADTGSCLDIDSTLCPICGYLFQTDMPSTSYTERAYFAVEGIMYEDTEIKPYRFYCCYLGRSPPA